MYRVARRLRQYRSPSPRASFWMAVQRDLSLRPISQMWHRVDPKERAHVTMERQQHHKNRSNATCTLHPMEIGGRAMKYLPPSICNRIMSARYKYHPNSMSRNGLSLPLGMTMRSKPRPCNGFMMNRNYHMGLTKAEAGILGGEHVCRSNNGVSALMLEFLLYLYLREQTSANSL